MIFYIIALIAVIRLFTNIHRLIATKYYFNHFKRKDEKINRYTRPIENLFNAAGTQYIVLVTKRFALNQMSDAYISDCLGDPKYRDELLKIFDKTIGVFAFRIRQTFYPTYWLNLPVNILNHLNFSPKAPISIIINILGWILSFVATYFLEKYFDLIVPSDFFQSLIP